MKPSKLFLLALTLTAATAFTSQLWAQDTGEEEIEEIEEVQVVEVVQAVSVGTDAHEKEGHTLLSVYGRLHPAFVHLPVGFLLLLMILEIANFIRPSEGGSRFTLIGLAATAFSTLPALLSGMLRTTEMWPSSPPPDLLASHRLLMFVMTGALAAAFLLKIARKNKLEGGPKYLYLLLLLGAAILALVGGHMGGKLVFGQQHLPF